ncbi:MAG: GNAT family N-acetyltransferase, partial [Betaproteobacteria bacterium]
MILPEPFTVEICDWSQQHEGLAKIRYTVFVEEQKVPPEIERDDMDAVSVHAMARDASGNVMG